MDELLGHERQFLEDFASLWGIEGPVTIFDVGANVGQYALACREIWPDAYIWCFEPLATAFHEMVRRVGDDDGFRFFNTAVGRDRDSKEFHYNDGCDQTATLHVRDLPGHGLLHTKRQMVSVIPLVEVIEADRTIDLLKIDAEGHELAIMEGARHHLNPGKIKAVHWEMNSCALDSRVFFRDFARLLCPRGYVIYKIGEMHGYPFLDSAEEYDPEMEDFAAHREFVAVAPE